MHTIIPKPVFLTFLIITYRRPHKLNRLLQLFLDPKLLALQPLGLEIIIADDHSEDNTGQVIAETISQLAKNYQVRYIYRSQNLRGDRNLYDGYTKDANGQYVWFLCDDDLIEIENSIEFINQVYINQPLAALCGFTQGVTNKFYTDFGDKVTLTHNFIEIVNKLSYWPKTSIYLMRRFPDINTDILFEKLDKTLYSWIGIGIFLAHKNPKIGLLVFPKVVGYADEDFGVLRYSYRIFCKLFFVVETSVEYVGIDFKSIISQIKSIKKQDEIDLCLDGLIGHYYYNNGVIYTDEVLKKDFIYLRTHLILLFKNMRRIQKCFCLLALIMLNLFPRQIVILLYKTYSHYFSKPSGKNLESKRLSA